MLRSVGGIIVGYLVFGVSAALLFALTGRDPHAPQDAPFLILSTLCGMAFACIGGFLAGIIAGRRPVLHAAIVAAIIVVGAVVSLFTSPGGGVIWSQLAALLLMAPSALLGGALRRRR